MGCNAGSWARKCWRPAEFYGEFTVQNGEDWCASTHTVVGQYCKVHADTYANLASTVRSVVRPLGMKLGLVR